MKAVLCKAWGPPESLAVDTLPDPVPEPGEVVIEVKAASVNFPDVLIVQNKYQVKPDLPFVPGTELSGIVREVGEGVHHVKPGDAVVAVGTHGGFAELARMRGDDVMALPEGLDFETAAAFFMAYGTSYHAVADRGGLKAGETLLVLGAAGGVGLAAIGIAKALGARVIAAASSEEKLAVCRVQGADDTVDYSRENLRERLKALTGGRGPDVVLDPVGGDYAEPAFRSIGWRGRYLVVGFANGDIPRLAFNLPLLKGASLVGVFWGDYVRREPENCREDFRRLAQWIRDGRIRPHISARYRLENTASALRDMADRKVTGKVLVLP